MRALALECRKLRRKHVALILLCMVAAALAWIYLGARQEGQGSETGWAAMLYAAPLINSVFLSLLSAVVASRVADVDHEANAWKQLLCLQRTSRLLGAKLACAALALAAAVLLEAAGLVGIGCSFGFPAMPDGAVWAALLLSQLASCLGIVAIVGAVALRWESQFVSIAVGLALSLAGLFSSFLPATLQRLMPSGYFTLLSPMRVSWHEPGTAPTYYQMGTPWADYALLALCVVAVCALSYVSFSRRES